jgi:hypothetical protein
MVDLVDFVKTTVRPMAEYTFPYVTSVVGILDETEGQQVGSGLLCVLEGRRCVVTAYHVVLEAKQCAMGAGFVSRRGAPPLPLDDVPFLASSSFDLAVFFLRDRDVTDLRLFWPENRVDVVAERRSTDYLFMHGFPGERSRFSFGALHNRSLPYGVMERDDDLPDSMRACEFAMDYDPRFLLREAGGNADLVLPFGLSGSPVWRIGAREGSLDQWTPAASLLVGIVTRWNADKRVLLATGADSLLEMMRVCG